MNQNGFESDEQEQYYLEIERQRQEEYHHEEQYAIEQYAKEQGMSNLQIAIIYSSIIGSMLAEYEKSPSAIMDLKMQVKKFMFKRSRSNIKEFQEAIKRGNEIWVKAIDHFAQDNLKIDAFSTIVAVWSSQAELLARFVNLTEKRVEKFSMLNDNDCLDAEQSGYTVATYLTKEIR